MKLVNQTNGNVLARQVKEALSFRQRLLGLMFTRRFPEDCVLHLSPCRQVHTFFMNYAIDVVYLDANLQVVGIDPHLAPAKIGKRVLKTVSIIEMPAGTVHRTKTEVGHFLIKKA